jgi:heme/copper-type cytochrome/quinol oxidase subunit 2
VIMLSAYALIIVIHALLSIQRAHDFNTTGWLALLAFVPLANLLFWFIPGTDAENRFGHKPPPNGVVTVIVALIVPVLIVATMAAVAIPAYQQYVERARQAQQ